MTFILLIWLVLISGVVKAQTPVREINFESPPPPGITSSTVAVIKNGPGVGLNIRYYWIITKYPVGDVMADGPAPIYRMPSSLGSGTTIDIRWNAMSGATSYDVLYTGTDRFPSSGKCVACYVGNTTSTTITDSGAVLIDYTLDTAQIARGIIRLNNRDHAKFRFDFVPVVSGVVTLVTSDPASPANGDIWYNTTTNKFRCRENGINIDCAGGGGGWVESGTGIVRLNTITDAVSIGINSRVGKFIVKGTADEVTSIVRTTAAQTANAFEIQDSAGTTRFRIDKDGLFTQGIGIVTGFEFKLGNVGDTGASKVIIEHGDSISKPGYTKVKAFGGKEINLFPCGTSSGHACLDSGNPTVVSQDFISTLLNTSCIDAGTTDAYSCALIPAITTYQTGALYRFKANTANLGIATVNFGPGVKTIKKLAGGITTDLVDNDIRVGQWVLMTYDGTNLQMQSQTGNAAVPPPGADVAASYIQVTANVTNTDERVLVPRDNLIGTDGGANGNFNLDFDITDPRVVNLVDEFGTSGSGNGTLGQLGWSTVSIVGTPTYDKAIGSFPNLGVHRLTTTATSGQGGGICLGNTAGNRTLGDLATNSNKLWRVAWIFKLDQLTSQRFRIGIGSCNNIAQLADFIGLRHDTSTGFVDTTWKFFIRVASGVETTVDTLITVDLNYHTLIIYSDGVNNNRIYIKLDNGTPTSFCDLGCDVLVAPPTINYDPVSIIVTDEAVAKVMRWDKFAFKMRVSTLVDRRN